MNNNNNDNNNEAINALQTDKQVRRVGHDYLSYHVVNRLLSTEVGSCWVSRAVALVLIWAETLAVDMGGNCTALEVGLLGGQRPFMIYLDNLASRHLRPHSSLKLPWPVGVAYGSLWSGHTMGDCGAGLQAPGSLVLRQMLTAHGAEAQSVTINDRAHLFSDQTDCIRLQTFISPECLNPGQQIPFRGHQEVRRDVV